MNRYACLTLVAAFLGTALTVGLHAPVRGQGIPSSPVIAPLTRIGPGGAGYLADPQVVHLAPSSGNRVLVLSGTTKAVVSCDFPPVPGCGAWRPLSVVLGPLEAQIAAAQATFTNFQNIDLFQDDSGGWHAVVAIGVQSAAHPDHWTVLVHAHPEAGGAQGAVPTAWITDTVLSGSFAKRVDGNYDGKYFEDDGRLYLLYVKNFVPKPGLRNGLVLQRMVSPTQVAPEPPVTLLMPGEGKAALESERYGGTPAKLVEAPYITKVDGKYALVYSTGAYLTPGYKAGVAWADTLVPGKGAQYRKVLEPDREGVWGRPGRTEVRYWLQSQKPRWPNFTGPRIVGPGVASAVRGPGGAWWLPFNAFEADDRPPRPNGQIDGSHRRPYFARLRADVPTGMSVASVSDAELAGWLRPDAR